jgi:hypothetical protein
MAVDEKPPSVPAKAHVRERHPGGKVRSVAFQLDIRILVVVICAAAAAVAVTLGRRPFSDRESQLFWLAVNVFVVTLASEHSLTLASGEGDAMNCSSDSRRDWHSWCRSC